MVVEVAVEAAMAALLEAVVVEKPGVEAEEMAAPEAPEAVDPALVVSSLLQLI